MTATRAHTSAATRLGSVRLACCLGCLCLVLPHLNRVQTLVVLTVELFCTRCNGLLFTVWGRASHVLCQINQIVTSDYKEDMVPNITGCAAACEIVIVGWCLTKYFLACKT